MGKSAHTSIAGQKLLVFTSMAVAKELNSVICALTTAHLCHLEMAELQKDLQDPVWGCFTGYSEWETNMACSDFKEFIANAICRVDFQGHYIWTFSITKNKTPTKPVGWLCPFFFAT